MATIIVHGTFAREGTWWWDTQGRTFAATVNTGLKDAGAAGDLWTIGGEPVGNYDVLQPAAGFSLWSGRKKPPFDNIDGRFQWSGADAHGFGRLDAGAELANYLNQLAAISPGERIDIIAHSHGCNVVKLATGQISGGVNIGCVIFLACPHFRNADGSGFPYQLNPHVLPHNYQTASLVNIYSRHDGVQIDMSSLLPDLGLPPGMPAVELLGFPGTPVVESSRTENNPDVQDFYEDFEPPSAVTGGTAAHSAMYEERVGFVAGQWLGQWPQYSFARCWHDVGAGTIGT